METKSLYYEAPDRRMKTTPSSYSSIFLAGGITGCPNWQIPVAEKIMAWDRKVAIFNPRREDWDAQLSRFGKEEEDKKQIGWEFEAMHMADLMWFWFPCEALCPITLFEYGTWIRSTKPMIVGCHPDYQRKADLIIQTGLYKPGLKIYHDTDEMLDVLKEWTTLI